MTTKPGAVIKRSTVQKIAQTLKELPAKEREEYALREAIAAMYSEIEGVLKRGYSLDEVADILSQNGVGIKGPTLKQYLAAVRKQKAQRRGAKTRAAKVQTAEVDEPSAEEDEWAPPEPDIKRETKAKSTKSKGGRSAGSFIDMPDEL